MPSRAQPSSHSAPPLPPARAAARPSAAAARPSAAAVALPAREASVPERLVFFFSSFVVSSGFFF